MTSYFTITRKNLARSLFFKVIFDFWSWFFHFLHRATATPPPPRQDFALGMPGNNQESFSTCWNIRAWGIGKSWNYIYSLQLGDHWRLHSPPWIGWKRTRIAQPFADSWASSRQVAKNEEAVLNNWWTWMQIFFVAYFRCRCRAEGLRDDNRSNWPFHSGHAQWAKQSLFRFPLFCASNSIFSQFC